jgi:TonB family protein
MRRRELFSTFLAVALLSVVASAGQSAPVPSSQNGNIVISKLFPPVYPPLAQRARITGDVELVLRIRPDGSIESVAAIAGHPMLQDAALASAKQSQFECIDCGDAAITYSLTYQFKIAERDSPKTDEAAGEIPPPPVQIDAAKHQITVLTWELWTWDRPMELYKVRSAKCLYLWKCSLRYPL